MKTFTKTGQKTPISGQYRPLGTELEITLSKGDRVPPYSKKAKKYVLVDRTKHKK